MILVVGGTGMLGGRVVERLAQRGLPVRRLVHRTVPSPLPGVEDVQGDLVGTDLGRMLAGVGTVVTSATAIARRLAGAGPSIHAVDQVGTLALVEAAERAGVERFVHVSFAGVDRGLGPPLYLSGGPLDRAKLAVERRLAASDLRSVIVRPDAFQEIHLAAEGRFDLARRRVTIVGRGENPRRWVAVDDVAALVAAVATEPDPPPVVEFGGPQALTRRAAVVTAEGALGEHLRVQYMPRALARMVVRQAERRNDGLASALALGLALDLVPVEWDDGPLLVRGIRGRPASAFLRQQAIAARSAVPA